MPDADRLRAITELIRAVCAEHLTDEYGALAVAAAEAMAGVRGDPLARYKAEGWAAGIVRAVGQVNFLSDPSSDPAMPLDDLAALFGVSKATASARHHDVRNALDLVQMDPHWTLPSQLLDNPMAWMLVVNGLPVDVRDLPLDLQRVLADEGHVPFAPADPAARPPTPRWPEPTEEPDDFVGLDPEAPRLQLTVTLDDVEPPVWRTLTVPSDLPLDGLHEVLQVAMGWSNGHLHTFESGRRAWGPPHLADHTDDERATTVGQVLRTRASRLVYTYDLGDDWRHTVRLETRLLPDPDGPLAVCLDGAGACPPEDCGGPWGYADLQAALADPTHPEHREMLAWAGGPLDLHAFDLAATNRALADV